MDRTAALAGYRWVRGFGFPRSFPLLQFPNDPLIIASVAGLLAGILHGSASADAHAISYLAMAVWAYLEVAGGVNWFRHLLGLAYLVSTAVHLGSALAH
jgi:hypothetical protein